MKEQSHAEEKWEETKIKLKKKFALLADTDLLIDKENQDDIVERLQVILGKSKEEIEKIITEL